MKKYSAQSIRQSFLDFFQSKGHQIVSSVPMVVENDSSLFFINAGMNPFKDYFLGNAKPTHQRIANTQKCLRVSGKHNDIEEVGKDHYHHTMFEMLGNWSFGNYFKEEAIGWAWEFLTKVCKLPKENLYVTVFEGSKEDKIDEDNEAAQFWKNFVVPGHIIKGDKKDNFWEMGDTGPCGPCSEIHIDLRSKSEKRKLDAQSLINKDHPQIIEIWNIVFIQYERKKDGSLHTLRKKFVDTGMGLERLVRVMQKSASNYDTDLFQSIIQKSESITSKIYNASSSQADIAFRVVADHIRAIACSIADGQLPTNVGAGYVIRRILRRAVRYYYNFLDRKQPLLHLLVATFTQEMGDVFPELKQVAYIQNIILKEEEAFLLTLANGLKRLHHLLEMNKSEKKLSGEEVFEMYDTYGFPLDLSMLIAYENGYSIDKIGFQKELNKQKNRSRLSTQQEMSDWVVFSKATSTFVGYEQTEAKTKIIKYRTIQQKQKIYFQIVCEKTPFYAESGGQAGDIGSLNNPKKGISISIYNTIKENETTLHLSKVEPKEKDWSGQVIVAQINKSTRQQHAQHHSATHLLHAALKQTVGKHVQQKGCFLNYDKIRFDFSHNQALNMDEVNRIEQIVNTKIRQNIQVITKNLPKEEAIAKGATALFNEKYGNIVRTVIIDESFSVELCGGTHVHRTGEIGLFKILTQSAVASGIRRIEAVAGKAALDWLQQQTSEWNEVKSQIKTSANILAYLSKQQTEFKQFKKQNEQLQKQLIKYQSEEIRLKHNSYNAKKTFSFVCVDLVDIDSVGQLKALAQNITSPPSSVHLCIIIAKINQKIYIELCEQKQQENDMINLKKIFASIIKEHLQANGGGKNNRFTIVIPQLSNTKKITKQVYDMLYQL